MRCLHRSRWLWLWLFVQFAFRAVGERRSEGSRRSPGRALCLRCFRVGGEVSDDYILCNEHPRCDEHGHPEGQDNGAERDVHGGCEVD